MLKRDRYLLKKPLELALGTKKSKDDLGIEWWDYSIFHPKETTKPSKIGLRYLNLTQRTLRDMMEDEADPQQILPSEYRYVNDTVNLLIDAVDMRDSSTGPRRTAVQETIDGLANYMKEESKYKDLYPSETSLLNTKLDRYTAEVRTLAERMADDAMEADMRMGD